MIPATQLKEIRNYLEKAENPLFFFDDDPDGLCSYLLLKKFIDKGKGVIVKTHPILDEKLVHKVKENSPDYVFILDVPIVDQEFIDAINVPIIWLDHHPPVKRKGVHYYNSHLNTPKDSKPTTYYAYKIVKQNLWLAVLGSIADQHVPEFIKDLSKEYPEILPKNIKDASDVIYNSKFGELIRLFWLLLKGQTSEVNRSLSILSKIESPMELLEKSTPRANYLYKKVKNLKEEYESTLNYCLKQKPQGKLFLVEYPKTKTSFLSEISNELIYKKPDKIVIVARESQDMMKMSIRSRTIKISDKVALAVEGLGGHGGGHDLACGGAVPVDNFPEFLERFKSLIE